MRAVNTDLERYDLDREVRQSLFLLGLAAVVSGACLAVGLLAIWALG